MAQSNDAKKRGFLKSIIGFSIPTWINFILSFVTAIVFTRAFSPDVYGTLNIFSSSTDLLKVLLCVGLDGGFIRFYNEPPGNDDKTQMFFKLIFLSTIITLIAGFFICTVWYKPISNYFFSTENRLYCILLVLDALAALLVRFLSILYRMQFNKLQYGIQTVLFEFSRVAVLISLFFKPTIELVLIILVGTKLLFVAIYLIIQRHEIIPPKIKFSFRGYKDLFKFSFFSAPTAIIAKLNTLLTQLVIKGTVGISSVGIYASAGYFSTVLSVIKAGFNTYWSAYMYANYNKEEEKERIIDTHDFLMIALIVILIGMIAFKDVIYLLIGKQYYESKQFFSLILIYAILITATETTSYGIPIMKKNHITLLINAVSVLINIVGCYFLSSVYGLRGAAISYAISGIIYFVLSTYYGQKYYKSIRNIYRTVGGVSLMILSVVISTWVENPIIMYGLLFVILGVSVWVYRKQCNVFVRIIGTKIRAFRKA